MTLYELRTAKLIKIHYYANEDENLANKLQLTLNLMNKYLLNNSKEQTNKDEYDLISLLIDEMYFYIKHNDKFEKNPVIENLINAIEYAIGYEKKFEEDFVLDFFLDDLFDEIVFKLDSTDDEIKTLKNIIEKYCDILTKKLFNYEN